MSNEPKRPTEPITVDDLLACPPARPVSLAALAREGAVVEALFGKWERPRRRRLDPRRLIDRWRPPRSVMVKPPTSGKIVYSTAGSEDRREPDREYQALVLIDAIHSRETAWDDADMLDTIDLMVAEFIREHGYGFAWSRPGAPQPKAPR